MVQLARRYILLAIVIIFSIYEHIDCQSIDRSQIDEHKNKLENVPLRNDRNQKTGPAKVYSSSEANEFLSYDVCMQRMKCPLSRQEDCSEECRAGNTEEELEEYEEITVNEHPSALSRKPKSKFEFNQKEATAETNRKTTPTFQSKTKVDL